MDWLKEVIDNKDLKDDVVVTLAGGQTVPLGDIRSMTKGNQKLLADRENNLLAQEAQLKKNLETLQLAQAETAKLFTELQTQRTKQPERVDDKPDPLAAMESDVILGPLARSIRQQMSAMDELKTKALAPIVKAQQDMAAAYVQDRIEDLYERVVPDAKKSVISLDNLLKFSTDNNLRTRTGIPDIRKAYQQMSTQPITQEDLAKQLADAREAGRKEAADAARLRVPRPGIGATGGRPESAFKPNIQPNTTVASALDEAIRKAAGDPDIWAGIDNGQIQ